jgi:hypothetical protein
MTAMAAPSLAQIKAQIVAIRQKLPHAGVIGIRSTGRWTGESFRRDGEHGYSIHQCDSPLSFRLALRKPTDEQTTKVLITGLEEQDLGDDILLRLAKRRLFQIDPWQIVRSLFEAHAIDPRLTRHGWIAESLLELIPATGYPAARGGFLDAETVWPLLLRMAVGLDSEAPDLQALLKWSLNPDAAARFQRLPEAFRQAAITWLADRAGPVAEIVLHLAGQPDRPDAVPFGLVVGVLYHPAAIGKLEKATGKLETRFPGRTSPDPELMLRWSTAATEVVRGLRLNDPKLYRQTVLRADEILEEIQASPMAHLSDISPLGFDQRLARIGEMLSDILSRGAWDRLETLTDVRQRVGRHDQASQETRRMERVDMAVRLVRWLGVQAERGVSAPQSFADAAQWHLREGGFVDWARLSLRSGDPVATVSSAYAQLFAQVREIREQQSRVFAELLKDWTAAGSRGDEVLAVEHILGAIVAPLAEKTHVLLIVLDGMSVAVFRELLADLTRHEWVAISEPGREFNRPGLATIPSVTEFSRTSLLCGRLMQGTQENERVGFAEHPELLACSRTGSAPVLYHKAVLQEADDSVLSAEVRREIAKQTRRVVGVVVNAVDDHLAKGEQIDTRWSRDEIRVLPALLHEARVARRLVVLVSDHGHVLDCQSEGRTFREELAGGERWRTAFGNPADDELMIRGSRVLTAGHRVLAPWSERVRYGIRKNGYHGGVTPQEMVIPIAVLSSTESFPPGWSEQPVDIPDWWDDTGVSGIKAEPATPIPPLKPVPVKADRTLFDEEDRSASGLAGVAVPGWVSNLTRCPLFAEQKRLGGRGIPTDEQFTRLLSVLDERGGRMTSQALARALGSPAIRLPGLVAKAERVLNIDGYDVLRRDDTADTIELNRALLLKQFDLVEGR